MWCVVIEWDGKQPPTAFYKLMHRLGLRVRRPDLDKTKAPAERRRSDSTNESATTAQEGVYWLASESLARQVAGYAQAFHARAVSFGEAEFTDSFVPNEFDRAAYRQIEIEYRRRGRPPVRPPQDWVVTCLEQARSFQVSDAEFVIQCPDCGGLRINTRNGVLNVYEPPAPADPLGEYWLRTRFSHGHFEVPITDEGGAKPPALGNVNDIARKTSGVFTGKLTTRNSLEMLDGVYVSLAAHDEKKRQDARTKAVIRLIQCGYGTDVARLVSLDQPDALDAAIVFGPGLTEAIFKNIYPLG